MCSVCNGPEYFEFEFLLMKREFLVEDVLWRTCMWIFYCIDYNTCSSHYSAPPPLIWSILNELYSYVENVLKCCRRRSDRQWGRVRVEWTVKWSIRMRFSYGGILIVDRTSDVHWIPFVIIFCWSILRKDWTDRQTWQRGCGCVSENVDGLGLFLLSIQWFLIFRI